MPRRSIKAKVEEPLDLLERQPGKRRDRSWEKRKRAEVGQANYRGIPTSLNAALKAIAQALGVPVGDVARAFLEYALEDYRAGRFELEPKAIAEKRSLFPENVDR